MALRRNNNLLGAAPAGLGAILLLYFAIGALYAARTPAWQAPDEPAHFNYVRQIAETGSLPVLAPGDYDAEYLEQLKSQKFPPQLPIDPVRYEGWQPPLYYLLAAPIYRATGGSLLGLRLLTLTIGAAVVALTWLLARDLYPAAPGVALAAAGLVAFLPQHLAMLASVNNDALAETWHALGLVLAVRALLGPPGRRVRWWPLGLVVGLGFVTKLSTYPLAAIAGVALLLRARREGWAARLWPRALLELAAPALALGALWWGRNLLVYGGTDFLAMQRHDAVVQGQLRTAEAIAMWGGAGYWQRFAQTTFQSFWGQFGWMGVVMPRRVYQALGIYSALLVAGALGAWRSSRARPDDVPAEVRAARRDAAVLLLVAVLLAVAVYLYYNLTFVQFQGRYLYPGLPVLALVGALGLRQWGLWLAAGLRLVTSSRGGWRLAGQAATWAVLPVALAALALLAGLDVLALFRFIVPALTR